MATGTTSPTSTARVELGRILGAHGMEGQVRVRVFGDGPENLLHVRDVWLAESIEDEGAEPYVIEGGGSGRPGEVRLSLSGVQYRDQATALRGKLVLAPADSLVGLEEDECYWHQLVGCRVEGTDGTAIGLVKEIWDTGAHDVLVVENEAGGRHLLSTAKALMPQIDLAERRVVVEMLAGILDAAGDPQSGAPEGKRKKKRGRREAARARDIAAAQKKRQAANPPSEVPAGGEPRAEDC